MGKRDALTSRKGERSHHRKLPIAKPEAAATVTVGQDEFEQLRAFKLALTSPLRLGLTFNVSDAQEKVELARRLWAGGYHESLRAPEAAN